MATVKSMFGEPQVFVMPEAMLKMKYYTTHCDKEVGWLGNVEKTDRHYLVKDVFLFKQEVHEATTEITTEGLANFVAEIFEEHKDDNEKAMDIVNNLNFWGHSHVNMGVSPSSQDDKQMLVFKDSEAPWFLRLIMNKKGETKFTLYDYESNIIWDDLSSQPFYYIEGLEDKIKEEIKEKVTDKKYTKGSWYSINNTKWEKYESISSKKSPTNVVHIDNTKKPETKEIVEMIPLTREDILDMFDVGELCQMGQCSNMYELGLFLEDEGYCPEAYTPSELLLMLNVGSEVLEKFMTYGGYYDD